MIMLAMLSAAVHCGCDITATGKPNRGEVPAMLKLLLPKSIEISPLTRMRTFEDGSDSVRGINKLIQASN